MLGWRTWAHRVSWSSAAGSTLATSILPRWRRRPSRMSFCSSLQGTLAPAHQLIGDLREGRLPGAERGLVGSGLGHGRARAGRARAPRPAPPAPAPPAPAPRALSGSGAGGAALGEGAAATPTRPRRVPPARNEASRTARPRRGCRTPRPPAPAQAPPCGRLSDGTRAVPEPVWERAWVRAWWGVVGVGAGVRVGVGDEAAGGRPPGRGAGGTEVACETAPAHSRPGPRALR